MSLIVLYILKSSGLGQAQKCGGIKPVNGIHPPLICLCCHHLYECLSSFEFELNYADFFSLFVYLLGNYLSKGDS